MTMPAVDSKDDNCTSTSETQWSRDLVKQIAKDVGDALVAHIEIAYPAALAATPSTFSVERRRDRCVQAEAATRICSLLSFFS
jgi:hypothetical protein